MSIGRRPQRSGMRLRHFSRRSSQAPSSSWATISCTSRARPFNERTLHLLQATCPLQDRCARISNLTARSFDFRLCRSAVPNVRRLEELQSFRWDFENLCRKATHSSLFSQSCEPALSIVVGDESNENGRHSLPPVSIAQKLYALSVVIIRLR